MNDHFFYKINLPFSKKEIRFKEISTKNQLDIEKLNLFYPQSPEYYLDYHNNFLKIIKNCIENYDSFLEIDILDYLLFCLKIRVLSIGNVLELYLKSDDPSVKAKKITLDLQMVIERILITGELSLSTKEISFDDKDLTIYLGWPNIKSVKSFYDLFFSELPIEEKIMEIIPEFIHKVKIKNEIIEFNNLTHNEKEKILLLFPASIKNKIQKSILDNINKISEHNIFDISYFENQKLNFFNLVYIDIIRLIFSQNPKRIYEEIYILSHYHLDSNYVLSLSPAERKIYISFIEAQRKSQADPEQSNTGMNVPPPPPNQNRSVEDLAVEFGDVPPN